MTVTLFSEDRLHLDDVARVVSPDSSLASGGWARGLGNDLPVGLAARVAPDPAPGLPVHGDVFPLPSYVGLGIVRVLPKLVRSVFSVAKHSSVVVVRLPGPIGTLAVFAAVILRRPIVAEVVGDIEEVMAVGTLGRIGRISAGLARAVTAIAVRRAIVVRYVTENVLQKKYPPRPDAVALGFSDAVLSSQAGHWRPRASGAPTIIAVGSQEQPYKGHDLLIRALQVLGKEFPGLTLELVGTGRYQETLRALAADCGVSGEIRFVGQVPHAEVFERVRRCDVFAMPSQTEGLPRALVEAMSLGVPCVASRVGGMTELLAPMDLVQVGDLLSLCDAIRRLLIDSGEAGRASARNQARARDMAARASAGTQAWVEAAVGAYRTTLVENL